MILYNWIEVKHIHYIDLLFTTFFYINLSNLADRFQAINCINVLINIIKCTYLYYNDNCVCLNIIILSFIHFYISYLWPLTYKCRYANIQCISGHNMSIYTRDMRNIHLNYNSLKTFYSFQLTLLIM